MNNTKKVLSLLLAVIMLCAMTPYAPQNVAAEPIKFKDISVSTETTANNKPAQVKKLASHRYDSASITLSWQKVKNATGYQVYQYNAKKKTYIKVKTVSKNKAKVTKLKAGTTYKFKVRAYRKIKKKTYYGKYSKILKKKTIYNTNPKKKLVKGYLYLGSPQDTIIKEYIFKSDNTITINEYECFTDGSLDHSYIGTYKVINNVVYFDTYCSKYGNYSDEIYYDKDKGYFRCFDYRYGGWCYYYYRYYYETARVPKNKRISYYSKHICNEILV